MTGFPSQTLRWAQQMKDRVGVDLYLQRNLEKIVDVLRQVDDLLAFERRSGLSIPNVCIESILRQIRIDVTPELFEDKKLVAEVIYTEFKHRYSFLEALTTGNYFPWPHELKSVSCASQAVVNYVIAQACSLKPELWELGGYQVVGNMFCDGHTITVVDVGEKDPWVIDNTMSMMGPITVDGNRIRVVNKLKKDKVEEFDFVTREVFDTEESIADRIRYLQSPEGAANMLICGENLGHIPIDSWKSTNPQFARWDIRYNEDEKVISTFITIHRAPLLKRGLEARIILDDNKDFVKEIIMGHYFSTYHWAEFADGTPMVEIPASDVPKLIEVLKGLSVEDQLKFEERLMGIFSKGEHDDSLNLYKDAIQASYDKVRSSEEFGDSVYKLALIEALYQNKRNGREFAYASNIWTRQLERLSGDSPEIQALLHAEKRKRKFKADTLKLRRELRHEGRRIHVLDPDRLEDELVRAYRAIDNLEELFDYVSGLAPYYIDEAKDRITFVSKELECHADTVESLEAYARPLLGDKFDQAVMVGYARIFAEFLGHISNAWEHLQLGPYKSDILRKVKSHKKYI